MRTHTHTHTHTLTHTPRVVPVGGDGLVDAVHMLALNGRRVQHAVRIRRVRRGPGRA
jgi:hypothetical protein